MIPNLTRYPRYLYCHDDDLKWRYKILSLYTLIGTKYESKNSIYSVRIVVVYYWNSC